MAILYPTRYLIVWQDTNVVEHTNSNIDTVLQIWNALFIDLVDRTWFCKKENKWKPINFVFSV